MLIKLTKFPKEVEIENAVKQWVNLLAVENYAEAFETTMHDSYYAWTPTLLESIINGYGVPYENDDSLKHKVTKWIDVEDDNGKQLQEIIFFDKPRQHKNSDFFVDW